MRIFKIVLSLCLFVSLVGKAQSTVNYNTFTYKIDTVGRAEEYPARLIPTSLVVYQQGAKTRIEFVRVPLSRTRLSSAEADKYAEKTVVLGDSAGYFLFQEKPKSRANSSSEDFFMYMSKEELASSMLRPSPYKVQWNDDAKTFCNLQGRKVTVTSTLQIGKEEIVEIAEAFVNSDLNLPLGFIFNEFRYLNGTPSAFQLNQSVWVAYSRATYEL